MRDSLILPDSDNPLLAWGESEFPDFERLRPEHLLAALNHLEQQARQEVKRVCLLSAAPMSWKARYEPLERAWGRFEDVIQLATGASKLLAGEFESWEALASKRWDDLHAYLNRNRPLARVMSELKKSKLLAWQRAVLKTDCRFGGSAWERSEKRKQKKEVADQSERLCEVFEKNISASLEESAVLFLKKGELKGLPLSLMEKARERAKSQGLAGWLFAPHYSEYALFMAECKERESRREMYRARAQAASEKVSEGYDNGRIAKQLLALRSETAKLHGHSSYAHYCMSSHMLKKPEQAEDFLVDLAAAALPKAAQDRAQLALWMKEKEGVKRIEPWDYRYAAAQIAQERFGDCDAKACAYFAVTGVIERGVRLLSQMMGCSVRRLREKERCKNLLVFELSRGKEIVGQLGVSPFANSEGKEGGAYEWAIRSRVAGREAKACSLIFLQMAKAPRMSHAEVVVFFHEMGHALHDMLSRPKSREHFPMSMEWDAIETHSQFFEQLAWEPSALKAIGRSKGKSMPKRLIDTLVKARQFHSGAQVITQVTEALCDLRLHSHFNAHGRLQAWEMFRLVRNEVGVDSSKSYNRHGNQLSALASRYACANYSYLWSEALALNMFEKWKKESRGSLTNKKANQRFERVVIAPGSSLPMAAIFRRYTEQKKPTPNALYITRELNK